MSKYVRKARKDYVCSKCGGHIGSGELYKRVHTFNGWKNYVYYYCKVCTEKPFQPRESEHAKKLLSLIKDSPKFIDELRMPKGTAQSAYRIIKRKGINIVKFHYAGAGKGVARIKNNIPPFTIFFMDEHTKMAWERVLERYPNVRIPWRSIGIPMLNGRFDEEYKDERYRNRNCVR